MLLASRALVVLALTAVLAISGAAAIRPSTDVYAQQPQPGQSPPAIGASAQVLDTSGRVLAVATFREASDEVLVSLTFPDRNALTGTHGLQIHESGRCDPPSFSSAGGILNPFNKKHGLLNQDGPMAGDLPSLVISSAGIGGYNTSAPLVKISSGPAALLRPGGTSLVIFAEPDDDRSQPEGNAGARVACGTVVAGPPSGNVASALASAPRGTSSQGKPDLGMSALIAAFGVLLIGAGVVLRRYPGRFRRGPGAARTRQSAGTGAP
jgi:Cu-Zn family superoxide dismutase